MAIDGNAPTVSTGPATRPLGDRPASPLAAPPDIAIGDRYVALDRIGEGGTAIVYAAFDRALNRKVAVKLLKDADSGGADARLSREAQALARLRHPYVLTVYDVGRAPSGRLFVAMEFIEGGSLRDWLAREPRAWKLAVAMFLRAGEGLAAAHEAGLVHRDFKPDNVLVDAGDVPRVADFGLARELDAGALSLRGPSADEAAVGTTITSAGVIMGTPRYMAPEQLRGEPVDARADQFAFGVSLYEAIDGKTPFDSATTVSELLEQIERGLPPRRGEMPAWLYAVLRRAMAAAPSARFPSMPALLAALRADPTRKRRRNYSIAAVLVALSGGAVAVAGVREHERGACRREAPMAAGAWNDARRAKVIEAFAATGVPYADRVTEGVVKRLDLQRAGIDEEQIESCEATRIRHEQSTATFDLRTQCLRQRTAEVDAVVSLFEQAEATTVARAAGVTFGLPTPKTCAHVALRAAVPEDASRLACIDEVRRRVAQVDATTRLGNLAAALPLSEETAALAHTCGYPPVEAEALFSRGRVLDHSGDVRAAADAQHRAYELAEISQHDVLRVLAALHLAWLAYQRRSSEADAWADVAAAVAARVGDPYLTWRVEAGRALAASDLSDREARYEHALELLPSVPGLSPFEEYTSLNNLGDALVQMTRYEEARPYIDRARAILESQAGSEHPELRFQEWNLAVIAERTGHFVVGRRHMERAVALALGAFGRDSLPTTFDMAGLGDLLSDVGEVKDALPLYEHHLDVMLRSLGPRDWQVANARLSVSNALARLGRRAEARDSLRDALAVVEELKDKDVQDQLPYLYMSAASAEQDIGELKESVHHSSEAIARLPAAYGPHHRPNAHVAEAHLGRCSARLSAGDTGGAAEDGAKAVDIWTATIGEENAFVAGALACRGDALAARGDPGALPILERAVSLFATVEADPRDRAAAKFALARALGATDSARARALATEAQQALDASEDRGAVVTRLRDELARWSAERR